MFEHVEAIVIADQAQAPDTPKTLGYDELYAVCKGLQAEVELHRRQQAQHETQLRVMAVQFAMGCAGDTGIPKDADDVLANAAIFLAFMQQGVRER